MASQRLSTGANLVRKNTVESGSKLYNKLCSSVYFPNKKADAARAKKKNKRKRLFDMKDKKRIEEPEFLNPR